MFTAWAATMAFLVEGWWIAGLGAVELGVGLTWNREGLHLLRRPRFWVFVLTAVALGPFLPGESNVALGPLSISREGFVMGLEMAGRALDLTLAIGLGAASLSLSDVVGIFDHLGLRGLGFAVAVAMNLLVTLREMATAALQTIWLRGGARRPWKALQLFLVTTIANTLRYGDEVVNAAAVRAFDPHARRGATLSLHRADLGLLTLLMACTAALLVGSLW